MRQALLLPALACVLFLLSGCGDSGVRPTGQILSNGALFVPGEGEFVQITFVAVAEGDKEGASYPATFIPDDSTFILANDRGMPPGRYKVTVQVMKKHKDTLKGKFGPARTPDVFDILTGSEEIKIDLGKPPVSPPNAKKPRRA